MSQYAKWLFVLGAPLLAQTTWIVDAGNPGALPTLAAAVAVATDGDVIRVRNPLEDVTGLLLTKSLRILGEGSFFGSSTVLYSSATGAPFTITVAAGKEVCIAGCVLGWFATFRLGLSIQASDGRVTIQDTASGGATIRVTNSRQVLFAGTSLNPEVPMQLTASTVVFERCRITGRRADIEVATVPSAPAFLANGSTVHCVNSSIRGGDGHLFAHMPGSYALALTSSTLTAAGAASVIASGTLTTTNAVQASNSLLILDPPLAPTITATNSTVLQQTLPSVQVANFAAGQTASLALITPHGSLSALLVGMPGDRTTMPGVTGDLWLDPQVLCTPVLAVQNGSLGWTIVIPPSPALFATPIRWQGAMLHQGVATLGAPGAALLR